ncbi:carboxypeptidase-like regulatory domain-containing protein [Flavobacterium taihuense]|uniref:Lipoprotein n=1 Tax=Flavobacterium taihuense TaxID=2857508 RepID=A0ABS6XWE5_9FLAO|nr:carboxypeptidase-like regulatory domain-containing protein [Flavobacterium taihuense]MBW4360229.1 hypothetical protein [Flavobacterium taihuense]
MKKQLLLILLFLSISCEPLEFYGDTFYTVKGKITDANDKPVSNLNLKVYARIIIYDNSLGKDEDEVVMAYGKTNQNGDFQITFPKSNTVNFLLIDNDYKIIDSIQTKSYELNAAKLDFNKMYDYTFDLQSIKVIRE